MLPHFQECVFLNLYLHNYYVISMTKRYLLLMLNKEMPMPSNPAEREAGHNVWKEWMGEHSSQIEGGAPVMRTGKAVRRRSAKDYKPRTNDVTGYLVLKADSLEDAIKIAQSSPHAKVQKGTTVVREIVEMQM
jgi:hypothetical protein